jgi:MGT family glycosyltransferase
MKHGGKAMTQILMTTWHGGGTTPPLMSVARALVGRGHEVCVLADIVLRESVEATGAEHRPWTRAPQRTRIDRTEDHIRDWEPDDPMQEFARMRDRIAAGPAAEYAADVRAEIDRRRPDVLLTESFLLGSLVAADAAGVPSVVLTPTINVVPAEGVPPFGPGFMPATNEQERQRDRAVAAQMTAAWDEALPAMNRARQEQGLPPLTHVLEQSMTASRVLVMTSEAFDFKGPRPPSVRYVGPRLDDLDWAKPWTGHDGPEPLVLVSMSSEFQDHVDVLQNAIDGLGALRVKGLVTTGRGVSPDELSGHPNVEIVDSAPHRAVLPRAAAVVTHGGHGTVLKALAAGVPVVALPLGRDQHDIAARLVHSGAGLRLPAEASPEAIAQAVRTVLSDQSYRQAAARLARAIAEEVAEDRAVSEIVAVAQERASLQAPA